MEGQEHPGVPTDPAPDDDPSTTDRRVRADREPSAGEPLVRDHRAAVDHLGPQLPWEPSAQGVIGEHSTPGAIARLEDEHSAPGCDEGVGRSEPG